MNDLAFLPELFGNSEETKLSIFALCLLLQQNRGLKSATIVTSSFKCDIEGIYRSPCYHCVVGKYHIYGFIR